MTCTFEVDVRVLFQAKSLLPGLCPEGQSAYRVFPLPSRHPHRARWCYWCARPVLASHFWPFKPYPMHSGLQNFTLISQACSSPTNVCGAFVTNNSPNLYFLHLHTIWCLALLLGPLSEIDYSTCLHSHRYHLRHCQLLQGQQGL